MVLKQFISIHREEKLTCSNSQLAHTSELFGWIPVASNHTNKWGCQDSRNGLINLFHVIKGFFKQPTSALWPKSKYTAHKLHLSESTNNACQYKCSSFCLICYHNDNGEPVWQQTCKPPQNQSTGKWIQTVPFSCRDSQLEQEKWILSHAVLTLWEPGGSFSQ